MNGQKLIDHFANEKIKNWINDYFFKREGFRARMIVGIVVSEREYVAIPLAFKSEVYFNFCPIYQTSLN